MPRLSDQQVALTRSVDPGDVLSSINARTDRRGQALACCPAHDDRSPSLSLTPDSNAPDGILVHCFAGCEGSEVRFAIRSLLADKSVLADYNRRSYAANQSRFEEFDPPERYHYVGGVYKAAGRRVHDGAVIVARTKQWMKGGYACAGSRDWYVPEGVDPDSGGVLRVVASESDAAALARAGFPAVSVPDGDRGVIPEPVWAEGTRLVVIGDNDPSGKAWAVLAAEALGASLAFAPAPHKDAREALEAGVTNVGEWSGESQPPADADFEADVARAERAETVRAEARDRVAVARAAGRLEGAASRLRLRTLTFAQALRLAPQPFMLEGLIPAPGITIFVGDPAAYKSFVAMDIAIHAAAGSQSWHGLAMMPGRAAYIMAEGAGGLGQRVRAWAAQNPGLKVADDALSVFPEPVDLSLPGSGGPVAEWLGTDAGPVRLLVVDTLRRVSGDLDENHAEIGRVLDNLAAVRSAHPDLAVVIVHHNNKQGAMSGSLALKGNADAVVTFAKGKPALTSVIGIDKQKDGGDSGKFAVTLAEHGPSLAVAGIQAREEGEEDNTTLRSEGLVARDWIKANASRLPFSQSQLPGSQAGRSRAIAQLREYGFIRPADAGERPDGARGNWFVSVDRKCQPDA